MLSRLYGWMLACGLALGLATTPVQGATFFEVEPNNSRATAQSLGVLEDGTFVFGNRITGIASSADYYSFTVLTGTIATFQTFNIGTGDTILGLYDTTGFQLAFSDDDGSQGGFTSGIFDYEFAVGGTYFVAVAAFGDNGTSGEFSGGGSTGYSYTLAVNVVPEPSPLVGLLGLGTIGAAVGLRRRFKKA